MAIIGLTAAVPMQLVGKEMQQPIVRYAIIMLPKLYVIRLVIPSLAARGLKTLYCVMYRIQMQWQNMEMIAIKNIV